MLIFFFKKVMNRKRKVNRKLGHVALIHVYRLPQTSTLYLSLNMCGRCVRCVENLKSVANRSHCFTTKVIKARHWLSYTLFHVSISQIFPGNKDQNTIKENLFIPPFRARYVRIHPWSWVGHISLRAEFYGSVICKYGPILFSTDFNVEKL